MQNTFSNLRIILRRHGWRLLGACVGLLTLQFAAISWIGLGDGGFPWRDTNWGLLAIVLGLSVSIGIILLARLHDNMISPASRMVDDMEQLLDRARLMQSAMQPALNLLGEGLEQQSAIVDSLRQRMEAQKTSADKKADLFSTEDNRRLYVVNTLNNLCVDMMSRREVARTLASATESLGMRLCDLEANLARMRALISAEAKPAGTDPRGDDLTGPANHYYPADAFSTENLYMPAAKAPAKKRGKYLWQDETAKPLMSEFKFTDEMAKRRFKMN